MGDISTLAACAWCVSSGAGLDYSVFKVSFCVSLTVATMWIKWKRPGLRGRRGKCVH